MNIAIELMCGANQQTIEEICWLLSQLSPGSYLPRAHDFTRVMGEKHTAVFLALRDGHCVGIATLTISETLRGTVGHVEDVIVDPSIRREGIGRKLMTKLLQIAKECGVRKLKLTSRHSRTEAHALYESLGFRKHETNVYQLDIF